VCKHEQEQITNFLNSFEKDLTTFESLLRKMKTKYSRGLFDMGGNLLKYVFGTATVLELQHVSNIVKELQLQQNQISHSVDNQITYLKTMNNETKFNTRTIASLANLVKNSMMKEQAWPNQVAVSLEVLNETMTNSSRIQSHIRQIEVTIMQLQNDLQNLVTSLEIAFTGKLPISLVNPEFLSEILKSIITKLPPENSLLAGTETNPMNMLRRQPCWA
jgi:hypothetical protein